MQVVYWHFACCNKIASKAYSVPLLHGKIQNSTLNNLANKCDLHASYFAIE